jgi:polyhydroxybutyrate depolymerase
MWNRITYIILLIIFINCSNRRLHINDPNYLWLNIRYQNLERKSLLFYPENYEKENFSLNPNIRTYPLLISLHGGGGSIDSNIKLTRGRLIELKEKYRFFLLFPEGYDKQWNDGRDVPNSKAHQENIDDAGYIKYLIEYMKKHFPIDENNVYIFGISNGGMMSFRIACEYSNEITGFASIAATMPEHLKSDCIIKKKLKMILIHGTEDPLVPFNGGDVKVLFRKRGKVLSAEETIQFWLNKNECDKKALISSLEKDSDTKTLISHYKCKNQSFVRFYKILNGGHTWPGGFQYLPEWYIGKTTQNFRAEEEIIQYFLQ